MNGSLVPWRQKEHRALPGAAFFTDWLLGMGRSSPCSLKAFIQHPGASEYDRPALCHQRTECLGKWILLPKINANGSPDSLPPPAPKPVPVDVPSSTARQPTRELGAIFGPPLPTSVLTESTVSMAGDLHVSNPPPSLSLCEHLLSRLTFHSHLPSDCPLDTLALSPHTERSRRVQTATSPASTFEGLPLNSGQSTFLYQVPQGPGGCVCCLSVCLSFSHGGSPPETPFPCLRNG